jgi:hypothetical protein
MILLINYQKKVISRKKVISWLLSYFNSLIFLFLISGTLRKLLDPVNSIILEGLIACGHLTIVICNKYLILYYIIRPNFGTILRSSMGSHFVN